ncbi:MAG: phosphate butyryltransferase [Bacteroidetes bacterium GWE2_29_8]|nr:MAG: phosphate butyryltransferase [Bacteroidetes bacterium GWE2_29_8]OFY18733.1 MAG: phosphate butyryltransferase [Bacteroidetes bacterium GWF2_29_10]
MLSKLSDLYNLASNAQKKRLVLAAAHDDNAFEAVINAYNKKLIEPIFVGDIDKLQQIAKNKNVNIDNFEVINEPNLTKAAELSVRMVREKKADVLMKGYCETSTLLKAVLNKEFGLRSGELLSHIALFELPTYHKVIAVSDAAMNIAPSFSEKVSIIKNAVDYLTRLGYNNPKVALLAAVEGVKESMPITMEWSAIAKMNDRKQLKNCIIDGPLALDNAVSKHSAEHKGIISPVAGNADLLIAPDIVSSNILYKALIFMASAKCAAVIVGATAPIVLTSRSDSDETKLNSIALAAAAGF